MAWETKYGLCAALIALAMWVPASVADVIHLRTGESIKGRPLMARSDEKLLVVEDFLQGSLRTLAWDAVDTRDRQRLFDRWWPSAPALEAIAGQRLTIRLHGGQRTELRGLVVEEDEATYVVMSGGRKLRVPKTTLVSVTKEQVDPRDIWSPAQLVERFLVALSSDERVGPKRLTARQHFRIAEYARRVEDFAAAHTHYAASSEDEGFMHAAVASRRRDEMEARLRDAAALEALRHIRSAVRQLAFRRARERIDAFANDYPQPSAHVRRRFVEARRALALRRTEHFQREARSRFPKFVLKLIGDKVREKEIGLRDVTTWARKRLPELAFDALELKLHRWDDVTAADARVFWHGRTKAAWRTATYGAGTFVVEKSRVRPPSKAGASLSRDRWWRSAATKARVSWVMAWFVERSDLFQAMLDRKPSLCPRCNGTGLTTRSGAAGKSVRVLCPRCGGVQRDRRVRYR